MEQGTESGAWTSVHANWDLDCPVPENLTTVPMAGVRYLLEQMPNAEKNLKDLRCTITNSTVALSGPVSWDLLQHLSFHENHPLNQLLAGNKDGMIKLPEMARRIALPENQQAIDQVTDWDTKRIARDLATVESNRRHGFPVPPLLLVRSKAKADDAPRWCIFDGCHRALAYATADFAGKHTDPALLQAIFLCGSDRHDHQATIYDTNPTSEPAAATPYDRLLCGKGDSFFTAHAYGPRAKQRSDDFVGAIQDCRKRPFTLQDTSKLKKGQVNIFFSPPASTQ